MVPRIVLFLSVVTTVHSFVLPSSPTTTTTSSSRRTAATTLYSKTSDRAHIERNLEDSMGNDWREFRAKLVAQETSEGLPMTHTSTHTHHKELKHHAQLGDLFGKTIGNIFKHNNNKSDIFQGDSISIQDLKPEDPFCSPEELPCWIKSDVKINKHRWAHPVSFVEPGSILIANEKLGGVFHQTVVLIIQHCDKTGSIGMVINRPLDGDLLKIASEKSSNLDLSLKLAFGKSCVTYGGPVLPEDFSVLHGFGHVEGSTKLCPGVYVGGSEELINEVRIGRMDPKKALFVKGHAAWVPGQLSKEISKGVWYTAAVSSDLLLRYAGAKTTEEDNTNDLWADIMNCMGNEYANIAETHSGRGDMRLP